jgi:hypothetical protein
MSIDIVLKGLVVPQLVSPFDQSELIILWGIASLRRVDNCADAVLTSLLTSESSSYVSENTITSNDEGCAILVIH